MKSEILASIRQEYMLAELDEATMYDDPILQFQQWFEQALHAELEEVNAMNLATVDASGKPHNRIVLLKGLEDEKFVFYTNYSSAKGRDMVNNPAVSLNFFWMGLQRQVRIEGKATPVDRKVSENYFHSRPIDSQLGAWASQQSEVLAHRQELETRFQQLKKQYHNAPVPCPPHWGGYAVDAEYIEFWQGRQSRLHDRIRYVRLATGGWRRERLNP
ncbi:MAG: pyridoxamine 5'-phosphate oxidase [Chitinophagaceae bacterium]|nr:pyridoxamine 5'-phosphate oxidase [Chitinophagaceae bacterium]